MASFDKTIDAITYIEVLINDSDPKKGIPLDRAKFNYLQMNTNVFSICPILILRYIFEPNDNKPKPFDELYINIYKVVGDEKKSTCLLKTSVTIISNKVTMIKSPEGNMEQYDMFCVASSIYTLSNKMNISFKNTTSKDAIQKVMGLSENALNQLKADPEYETKDSMDWIFSQKTSLDILKKLLRHTHTGDIDDIPLLYTYPNRESNLTSLKKSCEKETKCTIIDTNLYNTIDDKDKPNYLKFYGNSRFDYKGATNLLDNGFGQTLYQYNPWADQNYGDSMVAILLNMALLVNDFVNEFLKPLDPNFKHPDVLDDGFVYKAYESLDYGFGAVLPGTPIKPSNANSNKSTLKYTGIHTPHLHDFYNVKPSIYENIVRSFFSNSLTLTCFTNGQNERFGDFSQFPMLGECVDVQLNSVSDDEEYEKNGKYFIGKYTLIIDGLKTIPKITYTLYRDTLNKIRKDEE